MVTTQALSIVFDHFDRNLLTPYAIGFDGVFDRLNHYMVHQYTGAPPGFPPYHIRKEGDYSYTIEMAVAGMSKDDLEVEVADSTLNVRSKDKQEEDGELLHRGISYRKFKRSWTLADDVVVRDAKMKDGMLLIHLEHIVPEEKKPRLINIS